MTGYARVLYVTTLLEAHARHMGEARGLAETVLICSTIKGSFKHIIIILLMDKYLFHLCYK